MFSSNFFLHHSQSGWTHRSAISFFVCVLHLCCCFEGQSRTNKRIPKINWIFIHEHWGDTAKVPIRITEQFLKTLKRGEEQMLDVAGFVYPPCMERHRWHQFDVTAVTDWQKLKGCHNKQLVVLLHHFYHASGSDKRLATLLWVNAEGLFREKRIPKRAPWFKHFSIHPPVAT